MRTRLSDAYEAFVRFEEEQDLWSARAYGRQYWHAIRYYVFDAVVQQLGLMDTRQQLLSENYLRHAIAAPARVPAALDRCNLKHLGQADVLAVAHPRHYQVGNQWVAPYTTPLLDGLPFSHVVVTRALNGRFHVPDLPPHAKYLDWRQMVSSVEFLVRDAWRGGWFLRAPERATIANWVDLMRRVIGAAPSRAHAEGLVKRELRHIVAYGRMYERLLDQVEPKVVVNVVHYDARSYPLTLVAKGRGIPVVELQHGTVFPTHPAYNMAPGRRPPAFPDYILTFGEFWRRMMPRVPLPPAHTPPIGFAWLEQFLDSASPRTSRQPAVLFVSQSSIGGQLSEIALDAHSHLEDRGWRVVYKLHPGEVHGWRERMPRLAASGVEVVDTPGGIYDLFGRCRAQVGVYSTALFEGLAFGLKTFVADLPGADGMDELIASEGGERIGSGAELARRLRDNGALDDPAAADARNYVWRPGARENFRDFLSELFSGRRPAVAPPPDPGGPNPIG